MRVAVALAVLLTGVHLWVARVTPEGPPGTAKAFRRILGAAAAPGEGWRILTAPVLHGDAVHLTLNVVGILLFGGWLARARGEGAVLVVATLGALLGAAAARARGAPSLGASGAMYALAGAVLVSGEVGRLGRGLAGGWVALGLLGGAVAGGADQWSHALGAALGAVSGAAPSPGGVRALPLALVWLAGVGLLVPRAPAAREAVIALRPRLAVLAAARAYLQQAVRWREARHRAVGALLEAARAGQDLAGPTAALREVLLPGAALHETAEALREVAPEGSPLRSLPARLAPGEAPAWFLRGDEVLEVEESREAEWKQLLEVLEADDAAVEEAGELLEREAEALWVRPGGEEERASKHHLG